MDLSDIESRLHTQRFDLEAAAAITILEQLANRCATARGQGFERHYACVETALDIVRDAFALDRVPATLRARLIAQVEADHPVCRAPMARASMGSCRRMLASIA